MAADTLRCMQDQEVAIYETIDEISDSESENFKEKENSDIESDPISLNAALTHFVEPPSRSNETVIDKITRVRKEIEEIRKAGAILESQDLLDELYGALKNKRTVHNGKLVRQPGEVYQPPVNSQDLNEINENGETSTENFLKIESRLAAVESKVGISARSNQNESCLFESIERIKKIIDLLTSDPKVLEDKVNALRKITLNDNFKHVQKIEWLYKRISTLDADFKMVPQLVSRLKTLNAYHNKSLSNVETTNETKEIVSNLETEVKAWRNLLSKLEIKVEEFISTSNANIMKYNSH